MTYLPDAVRAQLTTAREFETTTPDAEMDAIGERYNDLLNAEYLGLMMLVIQPNPDPVQLKAFVIGEFLTAYALGRRDAKLEALK